MPKGGNGGGGGKPGGGDGGVNQINGNKRDNHIIGTDGDDVIFAKEGNDTVEGGKGNDRLIGGDGDDTLYGQEGNDSLHGSPGDDLLDGGEDNDWLQGNTGSDTMDGGAGYDTASFQEIAATSLDGDGLILTTTYDASTDSSTYTVFNPDTLDTDTVLNVEQVIGSNYNDTMTGGDGKDTLIGNRGDDSIAGGGGDDEVYGSLDNDTLSGGGGADTFTFLRYGTDGDTLTADRGLGDGVDVVTDFDPTEGDRILFLGNEDFRSTANLVLSSADSGASTRVDYASDSWFVLEGVAFGTAITIDFEPVDV